MADAELQHTRVTEAMNLTVLTLRNLVRIIYLLNVQIYAVNEWEGLIYQCKMSHIREILSKFFGMCRNSKLRMIFIV